MLIQKYLFLLIFIFTPVFTNMDKSEFIFMNVYEPYEHQINSFKENLNNALDSVNHFLETQLLSAKFNHHDQNQSANNESTLENSPQFQENYQIIKTHHRMLKDKEGQCLNNGFTVNTISSIYTCDGQTVSKSVYEENVDKICSAEKTPKDFCYCPYDFYGTYCEKFNPIDCTLEPNSHPPKDCESSNPQNYVSSYGQNDKPCYSLKRDSQLNLIFRAKCQSSNPQWNYEGIKTTQDIAYEPVLRDNAFKYELDTENLKASDLSIFSVQLKFVNWNRLFKPYIIETFLKPAQIAGSQDIIFSVKLDSKFEEYRLSGRYHYELLANEPYLTSNKISGVLEDSNFTEPRNKKKMKNIKYMLYIVLTFIIVGVTFVVLKHKNIISWRKTNRKETYEPLIEMLDHSHTSN